MAIKNNNLPQRINCLDFKGVGIVQILCMYSEKKAFSFYSVIKSSASFFIFGLLLSSFTSVMLLL